MYICTETIPKVTSEAAEAAILETEENAPLVIPGTLLGNPPDLVRESGVIVTGKKWETGRTIKCSFVGGERSVITKVKQVAAIWSQFANLKFQWVAEGRGEVRIAFEEGDGSWSYIGTDALVIPKGEPTMNFGWLTPDTSDTEYSRVVLHEFGHMLGMPHEHQNPAGGIPWDKEAVYAYYGAPPNNWDKETIDRNVFYRYSESQTKFSEFDRASIMLYAISNDLTIGDFSVGWNVGLSEMDKKFIAWQYPRQQAKPPAHKLPTTNITNVALRGVQERTLVLKRGDPFFVAEPYEEV